VGLAIGTLQPIGCGHCAFQHRRGHHAPARPPVYPVSCGISLERFRPKPQADPQALRQRFGLDPDKITFLYIGRVDGEKRLEVLIQALHQLMRQDIHLVIAGKGADCHRLVDLASQLGIEQQVQFLGFVPEADKVDLLNSADVFAMPSEAELLSIATLEAMACGRPVLAARSKALPELVDEGINGYLFKPGDVGDAARKMALLANHPERWERMGAASLEKARRHGLEATVQKYEKIYAALSSDTTQQPEFDVKQHMSSLTHLALVFPRLAQGNRIKSRNPQEPGPKGI
jgi:1,2-diacylglycerol 3-alpha-glucosyltransferase